MEREEIDDSILFDLVKESHFQGEIEDPTCKHTLTNPVCGDEVTFYIRLNDLTEVEEIRFKTKGCFICKAAAAALAKFSSKKEQVQILSVIERFRTEFVSGDKCSLETVEFKLLHELRSYPTRVKCVLLSFETLAGALKLSVRS